MLLIKNSFSAKLLFCDACSFNDLAPLACFGTYELTKFLTANGQYEYPLSY